MFLSPVCLYKKGVCALHEGIIVKLLTLFALFVFALPAADFVVLGHVNSKFMPPYLQLVTSWLCSFILSDHCRSYSQGLTSAICVASESRVSSVMTL